MSARRTNRIAATSGLAAVIALAGFALGYARSQEAPQETPELGKSFESKVPPYSHLVLMKDKKAGVQITDAEREQFRTKTSALLPALLKRQQEAWREEWEEMRLREEGKILNINGAIYDGTMATYQIWNKTMVDLMKSESAIAVVAANIIGKKRNDQFRRIVTERRRKFIADSYEVMVDPKNAEALGLSQAQQNQLILLEAHFADLVANRPSPGTFKLEEELPHRAEDRKTVRNANTTLKSLFLSSASTHLSPVQRLKLRALVADKLYVLP